MDRSAQCFQMWTDDAHLSRSASNEARRPAKARMSTTGVESLFLVFGFLLFLLWRRRIVRRRLALRLSLRAWGPPSTSLSRSSESDEILIQTASSQSGRVEEGARSEPTGSRSVSLPRSSNRTCPFRASGFPTDFTNELTEAAPDVHRGAVAPPTSRTQWHPRNWRRPATPPCGGASGNS